MSTIIEQIQCLSEDLCNVRLKEITVNENSWLVDFDFICDRAVSLESQLKVEEKLISALPKDFKVGEVKFTKILADGELVSISIYKFLIEQHKSIAYSISKNSISSEFHNGNCQYIISLHDDLYKYFSDNNLIGEINKYLSSVFCLNFFGKLENVGETKVNDDVLKAKIVTSEYDVLSVRSFIVGEPIKLWGDDIYPTAVYMADSGMVNGDVTFAGTVVSITKKTTKVGKDFYVFEFTDTTEKIQGKVFLTKEKEKKIDKINIGTQILTRGNMSIFNGNKSYIIKDLSFCEFPSDFVPIEREGKRAPDDYVLIKPSEIEDISQANFFSTEHQTEPCLIGKSFVVVDIETTGLSYISGDKITEIGAVRIVDGKIIDKFQTLINPERKISEEITNITGIDDNMVSDKPTFDKILPDFYKYCEGSTIVAHNIEFDYKFIKFMSSKFGYIFKNKGIDTLAFSKEVLPKLKNHKLNTICDYFGIEFLHHRALSDAHATAKMFIKLIEVKKKLPE